MLTKYARAEILEVKGSKDQIKTAGLDHMSDYEDYRTDDGYLYTRVRAISSRVNKNHDGWPSEELAKSYLTFMGKPIFVDHHNSDPGRARGVIVDAKLHIENDLDKASAFDSYYASAPENHKPPTWVELLLEVDAKAYPKLAAAIINDEIDGVSMGANVERSRCSHCGNWATSPEEYCQHIRNKGALYDYHEGWDHSSSVAKASYEDCYDIGFFEISYVFDPADETALVSQVTAKTAAPGGSMKPTNREKAITPPKKEKGPRNLSVQEQAELDRRKKEKAKRDKHDDQYNPDRVDILQKEKDQDAAMMEKSLSPEQIGEEPYIPSPVTTPGLHEKKLDERMEEQERIRNDNDMGGPPDQNDLIPPTRWTDIHKMNEFVHDRAPLPTDKKDHLTPEEADSYLIPDDVVPLDHKPYDPTEFEKAHENSELLHNLRKTPAPELPEFKTRPKPEPPDRALPPKPKYKQTNFEIQRDGSVHYANGMDMGGMGAIDPAGGGAQPALPGANAGNCPTCGGHMENGVCPKCTQQPMEPGAGQDDGGMQSMGSVRTATPQDDFERAMGMPPRQPIQQDVQGEAERAMLPISELADQLVRSAIGSDPDAMVHELQQWANGMSDGEAQGEINAAQERMHQEEYGKMEMTMNGEPPMPDMPADPFLSKFKIARDGSVRYATDPTEQARAWLTEQLPQHAQIIQSLAPASILSQMENMYPGGWQAWQAQCDRAAVAATKTAQPDLPQSMMTVAPERINTLRQEKVCDVCGSDMDDGKCDVCNYEEPPEGFDNPDLQKAQEIAEQAANDGGMGAAPPGVMGPEGGGGPPPGAPPGPGGATGAPASMPTASTRNKWTTSAVTIEHTAGKIKGNEKPILPATKTVSDHPKATTVVKDTNRLTTSHRERNMTLPTKNQIVAQMVSRGTAGVKTAAEAEALLEKSKLLPLLAANPASDPAEHHQNVDQVGGEVAPPEAGVQHINVEKAVDITGIPTDTWSGTKDQTDPVTSEVGSALGGPIGEAVASTKLSDIFPGTDSADKQIDVTKPLQPEFTKGPDTDSWSGTKDQQDPVTTENANQIGGPIGEAMASRTDLRTHIFSALKVAEDMINLGLVPAEQKFELATQLENETPEQLQTRTEMLSKVRTAGLNKSQTVRRAPSLVGPRTAHASIEITDETLGDSALFSR